MKQNNTVSVNAMRSPHCTTEFNHIMSGSFVFINRRLAKITVFIQ